MKWYAHDPSAALAGMIGLTVEERGAYYTLMDLQYARAPHGDVTDELVIKALSVRPQVWRRLKGSLMAKGKVHETDGKLTANRVETEVKLAVNRMDKGVVSETKSAKTNGLDGIRARATTTTTTTVERKEKEKNLSKGFSPSLSKERPPMPPNDLAERRRRVQQELAEMTDAEVTEWCKQTRGPDGADHSEKLRSANGGLRHKNGLGG